MNRVLVIVAIVLAGIIIFDCGQDEASSVVNIAAGDNAAEMLQEALLNAKPGTVVVLPEGTIKCASEISCSVDGVTLRGAGHRKSILSFKEQIAGAQGMMFTGNDVTLEDFAVEDTKGDGIKVEGVSNVVFRRVRAEWTAGPLETNGGYGLYPILCKNVLMEDCEVYCASDSGIYCGQTDNVIVRRNKVERNVVGIEIENTVGSDVYENIAKDNSCGIFVFDLPGLRGNGRNSRTHHNVCEDNNHENFASTGTIVSTVPPGTGMMIMAMDNVEYFQNRIVNHKTTAIAVVSFLSTGREFSEDKNYDPFPETINIHDNKIENAGYDPDTVGDLGKAIRGIFGELPLPAILWDGIVNPAKANEDGSLKNEFKIFIKDNEGGTFGNFHFDRFNPETGEGVVTKDVEAHSGSHAPVAPVPLGE
ncbi:MAG: right-handed parallel beta-helix repeat-containing protein [Planctomycetes bacterium]|nr:right-handed parallel beta-helix repeat-containing protein [Planctomycetota bacterium]